MNSGKFEKFDFLEKLNKFVELEAKTEHAKLLKDNTINEDEKETLRSKIYNVVSSSNYNINIGSTTKITDGTSYISSLTSSNRIIKHIKNSGLSDFPGTSNKKKDIEFASKLGLKLPIEHQNNVRFDEIEILPNTVIKPLKGANSNGVYIVDENKLIRSVYTGKIFNEKDEILSEFNGVNHKYRVEQYIYKNGKPADDLKCYSFYGKCALVQRISRINGSKHFCWYGSDGKIISPSEVDPKPKKTLDATYYRGGPISNKLFEELEKISRSIPFPFLRIDFLESDDGIYFGELTPNPGRYSEGISPKYNKMLGYMFEEAWSTVMLDLIEGKDFSLFKEIYLKNKN